MAYERYVVNKLRVTILYIKTLRPSDGARTPLSDNSEPRIVRTTSILQPGCHNVLAVTANMPVVCFKHKSHKHFSMCDNILHVYDLI